jgi:hypothetical protein
MSNWGRQKPPLGVLPDPLWVKRSGIVSMWTMAEGGGNKIYDLINYPFGSNGTLTNVSVWFKGGGCRFDGINDYVDVPNTSIGGDNFSVSVWINISTLLLSYQAIISKETFTWGWTLLIKDNGKLAIYIVDTASTPINYDGTGIHTLNLNKWYNIVFTYDKTSLVCYVNGVVDKIVAGTGLGIIKNTFNLEIGTTTVYSRYFSGIIDDIRIYNKALSVDEIRHQYAEPYYMFPKFDPYLYLHNRRIQLLSDTILLSDSVLKIINKSLTDIESLLDNVRYIVVKTLDDHIILLDTLSNHILLILKDNISQNDILLTTEITNSGFIALQDRITLSDSIQFKVSKALTSSLTLADFIELFETRIIGFSDYEVYPEYVITDLQVYGGAEMHFYPDQSVAVSFKLRQFVDDVLIDPDTFDVEVTDPKDMVRVHYTASYMVKLSTGVYKYIFKLPKDVIEGDWKVKVSATKGLWTTNIPIHFEVRKK